MVFCVLLVVDTQAQNTHAACGAGSDMSVTSVSNDSTDGAQWQLISYNQLLQELVDLPSGNTADATFLIDNASYDRLRSSNLWDGSSFNTGGNEGREGQGNFCAEVWNANFDVCQTLTNIPNGTYWLTAQGYYRSCQYSGWHDGVILFQ